MNSFGSALGRRAALTGYAGLHVLMFGACVALFVLTVVGIPLLLVTVGICLLLVSIPLTQQVARAHRWIAGRILGEPIPSPYRPRSGSDRMPSGAKEWRLIALLRDWARDPATWRDLLWLLVSMTAGFVLSLLSLVFLLGVVWYAIFPFLFAITPDGTFDVDYGIFTIDTQAEAFLEWIPGLVFLALGWWVSPALLKARAHIDRALLKPRRTEELEERVATLEETRAETVDYSAAELRRIERDLHDGAQARLVALSLNLGMADSMLERDPEAARKLVSDARETTDAALGELRSVVRGIHPPVLADRGLGAAVEALAARAPLPVTVINRLPDRRLPERVELAAYFVVSEALTNVAKHASALNASVALTEHDGLLEITVKDDGVGGADLDRGAGVRGLADRVAAIDGRLEIDSKPGRGTI
ncbi:MAG: sensor histidine kinase, partial [Nocardioidaceae bacterium]